MMCLNALIAIVITCARTNNGGLAIGGANCRCIVPGESELGLSCHGWRLNGVRCGWWVDGWWVL